MPSGAKRSALADGSLKRKRDPTTAAVVPTTVRYLQRGAISILDAVAEEIPDVFTEHILPKLDLEDTLRLAHVAQMLALRTSFVVSVTHNGPGMAQRSARLFIDGFYNISQIG